MRYGRDSYRRSSRTLPRFVSALLGVVMLCSVFAVAAPTVNAGRGSNATIKALTDTERLGTDDLVEQRAIESGVNIQIRNINADEQDEYLLRFTNNNPLRADGLSSVHGQDGSYPVMDRRLGSDGYPAITYERFRGMDEQTLKDTYGSNTVENLFKGSSDKASDKLHTAENTFFKYDPSTGSYTYDSKKNHAYFDTSTNKFTLYDSPLRPGTITGDYGYQRFGAFLPFNPVLADDGITYRDDIMRITDENGDLFETSYGTAVFRYMKGIGGTDDPENDIISTATAKSGAYVQFNDSAATEVSNQPNLHAITTNSQNNQADNWFAMSVDFNFFIPKGGKYNGSDMVFRFSGDDDVWVYIDGVLVVDQGGTHRHTSSDVNFATGEVYYQHWKYNEGEIPAGVTEITAETAVGDLAKYVPTDDWFWYKTTLKDIFVQVYGSEAAVAAAGVTFDGNTFSKYSEHKINFFFIERGGEASNCELSFNLPVLPEGNLTVHKKVDGYLTEDAANAEYKFGLASLEGGLNALDNREYCLMRADGTLVADRKTDNDGNFTLKANEYAVFSNLTTSNICSSGYDRIQITELNDTTYATYVDSTAVTKTDDDGNTTTVTAKDGEGNISTGGFQFWSHEHTTVTFTNKLKEVELTVKKTTGNYVPDDKSFDFTIDAEGVGESGGVGITLKNGESNTIKVPVGAKVTITEDTVEGYKISNRVGTGSYEQSRVRVLNAVTTDQTVEYYNELAKLNITIDKVVTGSLGNRNKEFTFTVTITAPNGEKFSIDSIYYDAATKKCTFTMSNGDSAEIALIPYGSKVEITENAEGYDTVISGDISSPIEGVNCTIDSLTENMSITYTNSLDGAPETGVFLDSLPYVLILTFTFIGAALLIAHRRRQVNFD